MTAKTPFAGEDENAGFASPKQDIVAAVFLSALSLWIIVEALNLKMPGSVSTHPGLLPIITATSMMAMAGALGYLAWRRRDLAQADIEDDEHASFARTAALFGFIGLYVLALDVVPFNYRFELFAVQLQIGAFEVDTTICLTLLLAYFWRSGFLPALGVAAFWTVSLASVFRYVFNVPLPGSF